MNAGYLFLIISWISVILIMTHWLDFIWKDNDEREIRQKRRQAVLFLLLVMLGQGLYIPFSAEMVINAGSILCVGTLFLFRIWNDSSPFRLQMLSVVIFLGIFYAVAYELFALDPILMIIPPVYMLPLLFALFLLLTGQPLQQQWLMMAGGFVLGEWVHKYLMLKHVQMVFIGDAVFRDQLAVGFFFLTAVTYFIHYSVKLYLYVFKLLRPQSKQEG